MVRILLYLLICLPLGYLLLLGLFSTPKDEIPVFLRTDAIAAAHQTKISLHPGSFYQPNAAQLEQLKADYGHIWAHLNHLYATNDITAGKEFYTEDWFRQLNHHFTGIRTPLVTRTDRQHDLHIQTWSRDGLVCTAIDSNAVLQYTYPDKTSEITSATVAVVLLFQGDHWRIDAIRVLSEERLRRTMEQ